MTAVISTMSFKGLLRQNSQDNYSLGGSLRAKRSLWHRCSFNGGSANKQRQNSVTSRTTSPRGQKPVVRTRSNSLVDYTDPQRTTVVLEKQDNETFGFEVQTYGLQEKDSSTVEMYTFVCKVQEQSPAKAAGLTTGDVIVTINGACTEGSSHQHIVSLIRGCPNVLTMETVSGAVVKRIELEKRLRLLKQRLKSKWVELNRLTLQEQRLTCGGAPGCSARPSVDSPASLPSPAAWGGLRYSSSSSCWSMEEEEDGGEDRGLPGVFQVPSPLSTDGGCVFSWDLPQGHARRPHRSRSSSLTGSNPPLSPPCNTPPCSPFGTLPRKSRKASARRNLLKFIPGLHHSVEEEEGD